MGASQCTCVYMGDNKGTKKSNPIAHLDLTSCFVNCTMYAYIEVNFIIYFNGHNMLSAFKSNGVLIIGESM